MIRYYIIIFFFSKSIIFNVYNSLYLSSPLEITGSKLFKNFIKNNIFIKNIIPNNDWKNSYLIDFFSENIIIKNSYNNYYEENNYITKNYYELLYNQKKVYNTIDVKYNKINGISYILWINLDRSILRKEQMEKILINITIPNIRINAIDGNTIENINDLVKINFQRNLNKYEIACTLSHIKAINFLENIEGNYFMICEDDILLNNLILFNIDLETIIKKAPKFDILLINKIYQFNLTDDYTNWNNHFEKTQTKIFSTGCYIISRDGINKIINRAKYIDNDTFIFNNLINFDVADTYIYKNLDTYVYKYNFITMALNNSEIHPSHLKLHSTSSYFQINEIINTIIWYIMNF